MSLQDGVYSGEIVGAFLETSGETEELILCFNVSLDTNGETVTCRHRTEGEFKTTNRAGQPETKKFADLAKDVCEAVGIDWPKGIVSVKDCVGAKVSAKKKTKTGRSSTFENWYIHLGGGSGQNTPNPADELVARKIAELAGGDDVPF